MPKKDKVIHISNLPSTFRGNVTRNGRFIQNGIPPLSGAYDKIAKSTGLIRLDNEFLYNGINNLVSKDNREKLMNNTAGRLINYVKDFNKESFPSDDELGPTFPFNIIQTPRSNGKKLPQKQYAVGGKIPNVVAGGIAQPLGNNFFYMNGRKHSQGGIDIGPSDKTGIEVEGGEVVETNGNELKVYSAQPIINGVSPAKLVMGGANPNKVFKAQEDFKDRNGINDDGTKAKYGKEKYVAKSDNTRVTPIMESPRNSGIKQGDFIYYPETYRIANNTLEKVPARKEVNMTPLEQVNPEFDILLGGAGVLRGVDKATKVAMALDKNISRTSQKAITKGRDALGYYSISPNIRYNLSVNNGRKALGVKPTKLLEAPRKQLTSNIGKYKDFVNILDSNGKVIDIPDILQTNIDDTKAFLKTFNKWNARYGYDPIPLSAAKNPKQADKLIKDRLLEHNTFVRGVHETGNEENINNILRRNGIEPTAENRAKYYASIYAPDTGAGRAGFNSSYNGEGTIYSSNSLNTGIGYAKAKHRNEKDGFVVSVRRPIKFEGNRENWVKNADFGFDNSKRSRLYADYELPYLLRYGKSARTELSKHKTIPYKDIVSKVNKINKLVYSDYITNKIKKIINDPNIKYKPSYQITGDIKQDYINSTIAREVSNTDSYNPDGYLELQYAYDIARKRGINSSTYSIRYDGKDYKILDYIDDNFTDYQTIDKIPEDEVKAIYYNNVNNKLGKLLSKNYRKYVEKQFNKQYRKAINKEIAKNGITDDELKEYIESKGIHPEHKKYNVITSEKLVKSSRNKGNPYQHFIFTGDVGKQGLDVVDIKDVNSEEFKHIFNTRQHTGKYSKGYSRKSRKFGGKDMIVSISGNVKNGLIHSPSSTGGLRDKFAVGGNRINRHGRTWEYDEQNGYYVPITNRTINRTSIYPINKSARGETIIGSDYTFRNGRRSKNNTTNNNVNTNNNKSNIDNGNRRPQYYAERRLPLFEDGAGITSGLVRAGWSYGNNKGISMNNINIPSLSATKSSGKTPRGGRSKSSQPTQSVTTKTPPTAVYNRNLPKVEASIPTTLPVSTSTPAKGTTSSDGKGQGKFKNLTTADWIGLGSNVAGSLASYFASRRAINKMRGPSQPTLISANKLKTKYNINPQLDRIREDKFEAYRDIDSNTASSRVSLARKQRVRNAAGQAANELYGNKENIETNLINQDRRNQQSVRQFNAQQYNQYIDRKAAFDNGIIEAKVTNINNLFSGINAGIQDMISRYENRKALNNTIGAMRASAPNVDDRIMRDAGVDYDEFIIRKRRKLGGKQSCR
ncbi:MAG: hypothetical protein [Bacteriophage sp.]|nr:MAG: hypothetical protein [Bacteriophage sp.]UWD55375.1 MAG: hypothetical protein [Bacteriophage sp.]